MTFELLIEPSAARDIAEADFYYAPYGRADAFVAALDAVFANLQMRPQMYPVVYRNVRRALVRRFPYAVFYVDLADRVVILAVHHQRRDPAARP